MIDTTKCPGCRKGERLFIQRDGEWIHVDLFATAEAGIQYKCENSDVIGPLLVPNGDKGTFLPNADFSVFLMEQEMWFEDILGIAFQVIEFPAERNKLLWSNTLDYEIEVFLLEMAEEQGIEVTEETHPFLRSWK